MTDPTPPERPGPGTDERRVSPQGRNSFVALMVFFGVIFALVLVYQYWELMRRQGQVIGDGRNIESYQFDLSNLRVSRDTFLPAANMHRDAQPVVTDPTVIDMAELARIEDRMPGDYRRFIVSDDEVIGIVIDGQPRAYPIRFLRWHEIINDELAGTPIAVTYGPLTDSSVVFDRRIGGEVREFHYSGLLYNSNLVMYDLPEGAEPPTPDAATGAAGEAEREAAAADSGHVESLWPQLLFEAVAGPAADAGHTLDVLPMWVGPWGQWVEQHPETTLFAGEEQYRRRYTRPLLHHYFDQDELRYPVQPLPPADSPHALMDRIVAHRANDEWRFEVFDREVDHPLPLADPPPPPDAPTVTARYFAWYAMQAAGDGGR